METCILFNAADRNYCHVFSNDSVWQRKLERAGAVVTKELSSGGKEYRLEAKQVSIRKLSQGRKMTEEQRNAARERLRKAREKAKENNDS